MFYSSSGGCSPMASKARLRFLTGRRFSFSASIVARPTAVLPIITVKDSSQMKWSDQFIFRGLKRGENI
jgi:hypothetical protein